MKVVKVFQRRRSFRRRTGERDQGTVIHEKYFGFDDSSSDYSSVSPLSRWFFAILMGHIYMFKPLLISQHVIIIKKLFCHLTTTLVPSFTCRWRLTKFTHEWDGSLTFLFMLSRSPMLCNLIHQTLWGFGGEIEFPFLPLFWLTSDVKCEMWKAFSSTFITYRVVWKVEEIEICTNGRKLSEP